MTGEARPVPDRTDWDRRYIEGDLPWDSGEPDGHLASVIERYGIEPGNALEVGCGTGTNTIWLARQGFAVTALDISENAIAAARAKVAAAKVDCELLVADFLAEEVPGAPFRFAYDRGVFHTVPTDEERARFASRIADRLGPEGLWHSLIGSTDGPPRDTGPPRRSAVEVVRAVEPRFEILELATTSFDQGEHSHARAWILVARRRG